MGNILSYAKSTLTASPAMSEEDIKNVKAMIGSDKVVIFSKTYCPYCKTAKDIFKKLKQKYTVYELDERDDGAIIQTVLGDITGAKSVPRVFINGDSIGGCSDLQAMEKKGTLEPLLA